MDLLKDIISLIKEDAAEGSVGANSIAATPSSMFGYETSKPNKRRKKKRKLLKRKIKESIINYGDEKFDSSDILSKIDAAIKKSKERKDTVVFGLEDEAGDIIKVHVKEEDAEEFEKELERLLSKKYDENAVENDEEEYDYEIPEIIYMLKDKFNIVDVEWPQFTGDEEEEQEIIDPDQHDREEDVLLGKSENKEENSDEDIENLEDIEDEDETDKENNMDIETNPENDERSVLQKMIDMMKADAEARAAEAKAKEAEARAKEAEYAAKAAAAKIKQEELISDMEEEEKKQKELEKEAKQLAKLAKYQYGKSQNIETKLTAEGHKQKKKKIDDEFDPRFDEIDNDTEDDNTDEDDINLLSNFLLKSIQRNS